MDDKKLIGYKDGMAAYVSDALLAQKGEREVREQLGLVRRYPVKTDLSGNVVMVEGDSHEDAVQRYLSRTIKAPNTRNSCCGPKSGRPKAEEPATKVIKVRVTKKMHDRWLRLGGSRWIKRILEGLTQ